MGYSRDDRYFLRRLGLRIRKLREQRGWSQEEFAEECGLHRTYIGAIERGERNVSVLNLRKIAASLKVSLADLFVSDETTRGTKR
ncbi:MAG: helix-turn-helix domain-containing protein [Candidatus Methylomirabilales bacterium]